MHQIFSEEPFRCPLLSSASRSTQGRRGDLDEDAVLDERSKRGARLLEGGETLGMSQQHPEAEAGESLVGERNRAPVVAERRFSQGVEAPIAST